MIDEPSFLQAIIAEPDDDTPRLVYADWLDEHGRSDRAEFIRIQCEMARLNKDDSRWGELDRRERALRKAHFEEWISPLRAVTHFYKTLSEFRRGFVEYLSISGSSFPDRASILFAMSPIRRATIRVSADDFRAVVQTPCLAQLAELRLSGYELTTRQIRSLAGCPGLLQLRRFELAAFSMEVRRAMAFTNNTAASNELLRLQSEWRSTLKELQAAFGDRLDLTGADMTRLLQGC